MFRTRKLSTGAALALSALATAIALVLVLMHAPGAGAKSRPTVKLAQTSRGRILVTGSGRTLYAFTRDSRNKDRCMQINGCSLVWPMLTTSKKPTGGPGIKASLLGSIRLPHRSARQVTYAGRPLYTYISDSGPAATDYIGITQFNGIWLGLNAAGGTLR